MLRVTCFLCKSSWKRDLLRLKRVEYSCLCIFLLPLVPLIPAGWLHRFVHVSYFGSIFGKVVGRRRVCDLIFSRDAHTWSFLALTSRYGVVGMNPKKGPNACPNHFSMYTIIYPFLSLIRPRIKLMNDISYSICIMNRGLWLSLWTASHASPT